MCIFWNLVLHESPSFNIVHVSLDMTVFTVLNKLFCLTKVFGFGEGLG